MTSADSSYLSKGTDELEYEHDTVDMNDSVNAEWECLEGPDLDACTCISSLRFHLYISMFTHAPFFVSYFPGCYFIRYTGTLSLYPSHPHSFFPSLYYISMYFVAITIYFHAQFRVVQVLSCFRSVHPDSRVGSF